MLTLAFETALRSIIKTPGVSILVTLAIALGVGITMPMVTLYHNISGNPMKADGDKVYRVLVDNWFTDFDWSNNPEVPAEFMAGTDIRTLMSSDIPSAVAASYSSLQYVRSADDAVGVKPFFNEIRATSVGFFPMFGVPFEYGAVWTEEDDKAVANVAVISSSTNLKLFGGGDNVGKEFKVGDQIYRIVGILAPWAFTPRIYDMGPNNARPEGVYVPVSDFRRSHLRPFNFVALNEDAPTEFNQAFLATETIFAILWVKLDSIQDRDAYQDFMDSYVNEQRELGRLPRPPNNKLYSADAWVDIAPQNVQQKQLYTAFIIVAACFMAVCLFNLLSLLLGKFMSVTPEACVTRALGATRMDVFLRYIFEVLLLGTVGGAISIYISQAALQGMFWVYMDNLPEEFKQMQSQAGQEFAYIQFDTSLLITTFILALMAAFLSALYPAWKACSVPPAEYLKMN
ncbi:MAG: ABC transporter permease [Pseudomonadota bacterium]